MDASCDGRGHQRLVEAGLPAARSCVRDPSDRREVDFDHLGHQLGEASILCTPAELGRAFDGIAEQLSTSVGRK